MEKTICDIVCPKCGGFDTVITGTDEIDFDANGTGHYYADVNCRCGHDFRMYYKFKYEITNAYWK